MNGPAPLGYRVLAVTVQAAVGLMRWRIDAQGLHHVPDTGGAVVTWNHTSHVDFAVTALPVWQRTGRWVRFLALRELWDHPVRGALLRLAHCLPVERGTSAGRDEAFARAVEVLAGGGLVMVAPEGRISESLELLRFRTGPVRMAQAAGVPLVPTASWGSHRFVTTGHPPSLRRAWRLPIVVRVGPPLHVGPDDDPVAVTDRLRRRTQQLLVEARAAVD